MTEITQAFILAAGRGKRMQYLTDDKPKPLVTVAGKCLIDYNIDHIKAYGIKDCTVNLCYKGEMIRKHLQKYGDMNFVFSEEKEALETGGGIKNALSKMRNEAFFVINSDALWSDEEGKQLLSDMAEVWDEDKFDMMLMLQPIEQAYGVGANGDYFLDSQNYPQRRLEVSQKAPYLYGGVLICHPRVFDEEPQGCYSLIRIFDRLEKSGRLGAYIHQGKWFHVGDPNAKQVAEQHFS
ncbi:MAG: nucleotidyltransferase family protein [Alphaproteobacteria bacterium]|nr:nucleotidyltransferase family protein [Alphaproteobacteria bacterium]